MNRDKGNSRIILTSSLALFSMFFGAGNMIFPPSLGRWTGSSFIVAIAGFLLTSVGIVMLAMVSTTMVGGGLEDNARPLGDKLSKLFGLVIMLAIGPGLAIPRTAATSYELIQASFDIDPSSFVVYLIFFLIVLFFTWHPAGVVNSLGNILTPLLLITLTIIIVVGLIDPLGPIVDTGALHVFTRSFEEGYQTMDGLALCLCRCYYFWL